MTPTRVASRVSARGAGVRLAARFATCGNEQSPAALASTSCDWAFLAHRFLKETSALALLFGQNGSLVGIGNPSLQPHDLQKPSAAEICCVQALRLHSLSARALCPAGGLLSGCSPWHRLAPLPRTSQRSLPVH